MNIALDPAVRQQIAAALEVVSERVDEIIDRLDRQVAREQLLYMRGAGDAELHFTPPPGVTWIVERYTATATANTDISLFLGDTSSVNLVEYGVLDGNGKLADDTKLLVQDGETLIAVISDGGPFTVNLRAKELAQHE